MFRIDVRIMPAMINSSYDCEDQPTYYEWGIYEYYKYVKESKRYCLCSLRRFGIGSGYGGKSRRLGILHRSAVYMGKEH